MAEALTNRPIVIGCMTGTSVDAYADFTAATFAVDGSLQTHRNHALAIPLALRHDLLALTQQAPESIDANTLNHCERRFTAFLAQAFSEVIRVFGLSHHPKNTLILSPHGQTLWHRPLVCPPQTRQLLAAKDLANATGYAVAHQHRLAVLPVSLAAPLAPVLLAKQFASANTTTVVINGGGLANICVLSPGVDVPVQAWDSGPANGILNAALGWALTHRPDSVPRAIAAAINQHRFDVDGAWAARGQVNAVLLEYCLQHPYFSKPSALQSIDARAFSLAWLREWPGFANSDPADVLATLSEFIAITIAEAVVKALAVTAQQRPIRLMVYGGLRYHQSVMQRLRARLAHLPDCKWVDMATLGFDGDFIESLLMAQLGFMAYQKLPADLSYMARAGVDASAVVPGCVVQPTLTVQTRGSASENTAG